MAFILPGILQRRDPDGQSAPVVFDSPHSGCIYPDDFNHALPRSAVRQTEDAFIDRLYLAAPEHGAVLLHALFPRSYIDPNRAPDDIDETLLAAPWPGAVNPGPKVALGVGLIPKREPGGQMYDRSLSVAEVRSRLDGYYWPYHRELEKLLDDSYSRCGAVWHVNCHSMPSMSNEVSPEGPGVARPDFCIGDRDSTTCHRVFTEMVTDTLRSMGYRVTINDPYKGAELIQRYAQPAGDRHSLQIEVNRALYMDEQNIEPNGGFATLEQDLDRLVQAICLFAQDRVN